MNHSAFSDELHELAFSGQCAQWKASPDRFGVCRQVWNNAVLALGARKFEPESGDHLVENQKRAVLCTNFSQELKKPRLGGNTTAITKQRLADNGADRTRVLSQRTLHRRAIVPFRSYRVIVCTLTTPRPDWSRIVLRYVLCTGVIADKH